MEFTLTITIANGKVRVDGLTPTDGVPVSNVVFNLLVGGDQVSQRRMLYALPFVGVDGQPYLLNG
jgi:cholesterol oxidase